jgi:hypothetical protein
MDAADSMVVVDRLNRAVETLRKVNIMRLTVTDRVNVASAQTDIIDAIGYIEAHGEGSSRE